MLSVLSIAAAGHAAPVYWVDLGLTRGIDLGFFPEKCHAPIDELFMETQPAHLQKSSQQKLAAEERDSLRAEIIRDKLKAFPKPDIGKQSDNGPTKAKNDE